MVPGNFKAGLSTALLVGTFAAILAFAGGYQTGRQVSRPVPASSNPPKAAEKRTAEPEQEPSAAKPKPHANALAAPKATLEAFLSAPDLNTRGQYVLYPETVLPKMQAYESKHPQRAIVPVKLKVEECHVNEATEMMLVIFRVYTAECYEGYLVSVWETPDGWKIDWDGFIDFQDRQFQKFLTAKGDEIGTFRVGLLAADPDPAAGAPASFILIDPINAHRQPAFIPKDPNLASDLTKLLARHGAAGPILKLSKKTNPDGTPRVEIVSIEAFNWFPQAD